MITLFFVQWDMVVDFQLINEIWSCNWLPVLVGEQTIIFSGWRATKDRLVFTTFCCLWKTRWHDSYGIQTVKSFKVKAIMRNRANSCKRGFCCEHDVKSMEGIVLQALWPCLIWKILPLFSYLDIVRIYFYFFS